MQGVGGSAFAPDLTMTRAQLATILYRYLDVDESELEGLDNPFTDLKADWYTRRRRLPGPASASSTAPPPPPSPPTRSSPGRR